MIDNLQNIRILYTIYSLGCLIMIYQDQAFLT